MRVRTFINRVVWLVVLACAGYAVIAAGSSYLQVRSLVDQPWTRRASDVRIPRTNTSPGRPAGISPPIPAPPLARRSPGRIRLPPQKLLIESRDGEYESGSTGATSCGPCRRGGPRFPALDRPDVHAKT